MRYDALSYDLAQDTIQNMGTLLYCIMFLRECLKKERRRRMMRKDVGDIATHDLS
jgi:hypothetical protein